MAFRLFSFGGNEAPDQEQMTVDSPVAPTEAPGTPVAGTGDLEAAIKRMILVQNLQHLGAGITANALPSTNPQVRAAQLMSAQGGGGGNPLVNQMQMELFKSKVKADQQRQMLQGYQLATQGIPQMIAERRYADAAEAYRNAAQFSSSEGQMKLLQSQAEKMDKMAEQVRQAQALSAAAGKSSPRDVLADPNLVSGLAGYEGSNGRKGVLGAIEELGPKREVKDGYEYIIPSPVMGAETPTTARQLVPNQSEFSEEEKTRLSRYGVTPEDIAHMRATGQGAVANGLVLAMRQQRDLETALKPFGVSQDVTDALAGNPQRDQIVAWLTRGTPEQQAQAHAMIDQTRKQVRAEAADQAIKIANQKFLDQRAATGNDVAHVEGYVPYDIRTGKPTTITQNDLRNPNNFVHNGGPLVLVQKDEDRQLRLQDSELVPTIPAAMTLSERLLAKTRGMSIPRGAELTALRKLGDKDIKLFDEQMRTLYIGLSRLESGSVRIPVKMFEAIQGTGPDAFSSVTQAQQFLNAVAASMVNRRRGYLQQDPVPIPTGLEPTVSITVKNGKLVEAINPTAERDTGSKPAAPGQKNSPWKKVQ